MGTGKLRLAMARLCAFAFVLVLSASASAAEVDILIVYFSQGGHAREMAGAVAEGVRSTPGARVRLRSVQEAKTADVLAAEAIVLGRRVTETALRLHPHPGSPASLEAP